MTKKLRAPDGTDEVNFGTKRYRVDNDGMVLVPDDAVEPLLLTGGCTLPVEAVEVSKGLTAMAHENATGVSWGGVSYEPEADGTFHVPNEAVATLVHHGFTAVRAVEKVEKKAEEPAKKAEEPEKKAEEPAKTPAAPPPVAATPTAAPAAAAPTK